MVKVENISKDDAIKTQRLLKELHPDWDIRITEEDINLYLLGFREDIPCSMTINVSEDDIIDLQEELNELETWAYSDEEILYTNSSVLTKDEKRRKQLAMEYMQKYERYKILQDIFT